MFSVSHLAQYFALNISYVGRFPCTPSGSLTVTECLTIPLDPTCLLGVRIRSHRLRPWAPLQVQRPSPMLFPMSVCLSVISSAEPSGLWKSGEHCCWLIRKDILSYLTFLQTVSHIRSPAWLRTHYVAEGSLTAILLPQPP